jgi:hypothetical protein
MDERHAHGYVLTLDLAADRLPPDVIDLIVRDLAHLSAARGPAADGHLVLHCTVSATSEPDAVRYAAGRALASLRAHGADAPHLAAVQATPLDLESV